MLDAFDAGAHSRADVARRTGLRADVVDAAVDHLVRMGRLEAAELTSGCPDGGCGVCASGGDDDARVRGAAARRRGARRTGAGAAVRARVSRSACA